MAPLRAFYDRRSEHADRHLGRKPDLRCKCEPEWSVLKKQTYNCRRNRITHRSCGIFLRLSQV
jgi:hypothetical protein